MVLPSKLVKSRDKSVSRRRRHSLDVKTHPLSSRTRSDYVIGGDINGLFGMVVYFLCHG